MDSKLLANIKIQTEKRGNLKLECMMTEIELLQEILDQLKIIAGNK